MSEAAPAVATPTATPTEIQPVGGAAQPNPGGAQKGDVAAAAAAVARKLKIDNDEVDESEVIKTYKERKQHQRVASRELNEGKALRKQAEEVIAMLKDGEKIKDVLAKLGHDPRKLSESILARHLEDDLMDPRDRELRDAKAKLQQLEDMDKKQKEAVAKQRQEQLKAKYMKDYETDFVTALEKTSLPPTKPMVAEMAKYIARAAKIGFQMTPLEAAQMVREDIQMAHQRLIGDSDGETLLKLLGDDVANKVRKYDTSKLKNPEAELRTPENQEIHTRAKEPKKVKRMSIREWQLHKRGLK